MNPISPDHDIPDACEICGMSVEYAGDVCDECHERLSRIIDDAERNGGAA